MKWVLPEYIEDILPTEAMRIENLRRETGCSERHFAASFRREFGLRPKTFANVLRFGQAAQLLSRGSFTSLTEVALACGYFDQAHFNRDFQRFAGVTPTVAMSRTSQRNSVSTAAV